MICLETPTTGVQEKRLKVLIEQSGPIDWPHYKVTLDGEVLAEMDTINDLHCRRIYCNDSIVLKLTMYDREQTKTEYANLKKIQEEDRRYFPRLIDVDDKNWKWIAVERVDITIQDDMEDYFPVVNHLIDKYKLDEDVSAEYLRNWGLVDGEPFIYDLGM